MVVKRTDPEEADDPQEDKPGSDTAADIAEEAIGDVPEGDAEGFVESYVQKGGQ